MASAVALLAAQGGARATQLSNLRCLLPSHFARLWSSETAERPDTLPLAQLAKACLAGNPRAQMTTVRAEAPAAGTEPKLSSALVHALAPRGLPPLILLHPGLHTEILKDLMTGPTNPASICYGATDPPGLLQRVRNAGWMPPRLVLLGALTPIPAAETAFHVAEARRAWQDTSLVDILPPDSELEYLMGFTMPEPSRCAFVDATGEQHELDTEAVDAALLDPMAYCQMDLLRTLGEEEEWQTALRLFCAAYLGVEAGPGAFAFSADRSGLTVLAQEVGAEGSGDSGARGAEAPPPCWRQFRFAFQRELRSRAEFMRMLEHMREEVDAAAGRPLDS